MFSLPFSLKKAQSITKNNERKIKGDTPSGWRAEGAVEGVAARCRKSWSLFSHSCITDWTENADNCCVSGSVVQCKLCVMWAARGPCRATRGCCAGLLRAAAGPSYFCSPWHMDPGDRKTAGQKGLHVSQSHQVLLTSGKYFSAWFCGDCPALYLCDL